MSDTSRDHKSSAPKTINFAVFVCSSSRYRKLVDGQVLRDPSGDLIVKTLRKSGYNVVSKEILPDDETLIGKHVGNTLCRSSVDAIILCGGTGISPRDVTIEAVRPLLTKTLPGFGELFRKLSFDEIGSAAAISRSLTGIADQGKAIFCIPGSPHAVQLFLERLILPEAGHILKHAREHSGEP